MKKFALLVVCVLSFGVASQAQNLKCGHINTNELISLMSERASAIVKLQAYQNDLLETLAREELTLSCSGACSGAAASVSGFSPVKYSAGASFTSL